MQRLALTVGLLVGAGCEPPPPTESGVMLVAKEATAAWVRNFNPLSVSARFPTQSGIYEPLAIHNPMTDRWVPWLATGWTWRSPTELVLTLRTGVRWSDGERFDAHDVRHTLVRVLDDPTLDAGGLARFVSRVGTEGSHTVVVHLKRPYSPAFAAVAQTLVLPEHVLREVDAPATWTNPDPVGTGPYTEVRTFRTQVFELGRNPHYWQGPPGAEVLRFPALASNDQLAMALIQGELDWAGGFVPQVDRVFVARDPAHHGYWYPAGSMWFLYANTTRPPLDRRGVREALSLALDRERLIEVAGWSGWTEPAGCTGLSDALATWRDEALEVGCDWVTHDPARAEVLLEAAGLVRGESGWRTDGSGEPLTLELSMVSGWSDAVRASQMAAQQLRAVGLDVRVRSYDPGAWFGSTFRGDFDLTLGWSNLGPTPRMLYAGLMASEHVKPVGTSHFTNWHRYGSPAVDEALRRLEATTDPAAQRAAVVEMQRHFAQEVPAVPLYAGPQWGQYHGGRFTGWPSAEDPWAPLSPNVPHTPLLVLTGVRPRGEEP